MTVLNFWNAIAIEKKFRHIFQNNVPGLHYNINEPVFHLYRYLKVKLHARIFQTPCVFKEEYSTTDNCKESSPFLIYAMGMCSYEVTLNPYAAGG